MVMKIGNSLCFSKLLQKYEVSGYLEKWGVLSQQRQILALGRVALNSTVIK